MIRGATLADLPAIRAVLLAAGEMPAVYDYDDRLTGDAVVDEQDGRLRGVALFFLGRPDTCIRQFAVHPDFQGQGMVGHALWMAVAHIAAKFGADVLQGFERNPAMIALSQRLGAQIREGVSVRWPLTQLTAARIQRLARRRARYGPCVDGVTA